MDRRDLGLSLPEMFAKPFHALPHCVTRLIDPLVVDGDCALVAKSLEFRYGRFEINDSLAQHRTTIQFAVHSREVTWRTLFARTNDVPVVKMTMTDLGNEIKIRFQILFYCMV